MAAFGLVLSVVGGMVFVFPGIAALMCEAEENRARFGFISIIGAVAMVAGIGMLSAPGG